MKALLPNVKGMRVLELGCGSGELARYLRTSGASAVTALDISERMIEKAKMQTSDNSIEYITSSIEQYVPAFESFDLVVSSLAFHYVKAWKNLVETVRASLVPGGVFLFSVEHPICTANPVGWVKNSDGVCLCWPLDRYQQKGARRTLWFDEEVIKYHRTIETYVNTLLDAGFKVVHLGEPTPVLSKLDIQPSLMEHFRRPPVLLISAVRVPVRKYEIFRVKVFRFIKRMIT